MSNRLHQLTCIAMAVALMAGCQKNPTFAPNLGCDPTDLIPNGGGPSYLTLGNDPCIAETGCDVVDASFSPLDVSDYGNIQYQQMSLQDCIGLALSNSKVFRDLGGTIVSSPRVVDSIYNPAIVFTDPQFSEEAALSAFDANFSAAAFFQNNDQASNLTFQGNNGIFQQDFNDYRAQLQKLAATGTVFTLRNTYNYDNSNQTGQTLPHSWLTIFEGEFRHPLLQGSGTLFNRIAGPSRQPGIYSGVLIARTNTEISLSRFHGGVRDLVSEVENAYWDLYFAYRNLEAVIDGRDKAYEVLVATSQGKAREGTQAQAQAKEQYLRFESDVLDAMEGRPTFGTRNNNGMAGGVFLSNGGVRVIERRLRLICGLPINGNELIRTTDEPAATGVQFDWQHSIDEAFVHRHELVQQKWLIKRRELQLIASKNFLKPRFDLIGQYRFRGLGRNLTGGSNSFLEDLNNGTEISSAFGDLFSGDFQEWQLGAEFSMPLGFRSAHLGVRNAELLLARERALLKEQKREVVFGLSNAFAEARRAFASLQLTEEQYIAAREFQYVMKLEVNRGRDRDIELEAQRRVVDAEIAYRQAQVDYMLALKNIHFEKGTYLAYCNVALSESQSSPQADEDAQNRSDRRGRVISYVSDTPIIARQSGTASYAGQIPTQSTDAGFYEFGDGHLIETNIWPNGDDMQPIAPMDATPLDATNETTVTPTISDSFNFSDAQAIDGQPDLTMDGRPDHPVFQTAANGVDQRAQQIPSVGAVATMPQASVPSTSDQRSSRRSIRPVSISKGREGNPTTSVDSSSSNHSAKSTRRNLVNSGS